MADQSEVVCRSSDVGNLSNPSSTDEPSGRPKARWKCDKLGIRKELIDFKFVSVQKASVLSHCFVCFGNIKGRGERESVYLDQENEQWIRLGHARTPLDYAIEVILHEMFAGERSNCFVSTKTNEEVSFSISLIDIKFGGYLFEMSAKEMYEWASAAKDNGVAMFKRYPSHAQRYFNDAAKGLISYKPFEGLTEEEHGINGDLVQKLFDQVSMNVAACLLKEQRYDEALAVLLEMTDRPDDNGRPLPEKAIYRRAVAHLNLKQYEEAKNQLERINYKQNHEMMALYSRIVVELNLYKNSYSSMVKKMFG